MDRKGEWRIQVLGWGNVVIGVAAPVTAAVNVLAAMGVFSVEWAGQSVFLTAFLGATLGYLNGSSGWSILRGRPDAFGRSCIAGGLTFGYTIVGILVMATSGRDRALLILIRHGSENWWDWSLSHFQNSALRELPLMAWWVLGFGTLLRYRLAGAPERMSDRAVQGLSATFLLALLGAALRQAHLILDTMLYSQR